MTDDPTDPRVASLLDALRSHEPIDAREATSLRRIRAMLRWLPDPFTRDADPCHVTASAIVVDRAGLVLLHRHVRLGRWLQPGGHVERGEDTVRAARRETIEETDVVPHDGPVTPILHVDVHPGPMGHVHLDVRHLLVVDERSGTDRDDVVWRTRADAERIADRSLAGALRALERHEQQQVGQRRP